MRSKSQFIKICIPAIYIVFLVIFLLDVEREMKEKRRETKISDIFPKVGKNRNNL